MSQAMRQDGPGLIDHMVAIMDGARANLPEATPPLPPEASQQAAARLERLQADLKSIRKMLFVKTQGGTELVKHCVERVEAIEQLMKGLPVLPPEPAAAQLDEALKGAEEKIDPVVEKARTLVIRMT